MKSFIESKKLLPQGKQYRRPDGTWSERAYKVMLHDQYAIDHPRPAFIAESDETEAQPFPKRVKYDEEIVSDILDLQDEGYGIREIAAHLGIPKTTVGRLAKMGRSAHK